MKNINYSKLPEHMQEGMRLYIEERDEPGDFLRAVLENKFVEAYSYADEINLANMFNWAYFMYNECPLNIRGSKEIVDKWIDGNSEKDVTKSLH